MKQGLFSLQPDDYFMINGEMIEGCGEDSFYAASSEYTSVLAVFDGCGGIGSRKYPRFSGHSGAYMSARAISGAMHGDFGNSIMYRKPVAKLLKGKLSLTLILGAMALALVILIGIPLGVFTAGRKHALSEQLLNFVNILGISVPGFFLSILIIWIFGLLLHWFTPGRFVTFSRDPAKFFRFMIFPAIAIAIPQTCILSKYIRTAVIEEIRADYVRTARSKGSTKNRIMYVHVLKNAIISVVPLIGMIVSGIFSGSIVIEQVFGIPGIGRLLIASVTSRDYPMVQTLVMYIAILILIVNFVVDILIQILDPRIRIAG